jgi:tripartite-type tricarboxylate transporter receptor subunit TctC
VAHAVNPHIHDKLGYRTEEDFAPVGLLARAPLVLVVDKRLPVQSLPDFLAYLRRGPAAMHRRAWAALRTWARSC